MRRVSGFTLLEVLVAMAIFSIVGLGAHQMLRTIIDTQNKTQSQVDELTSLTRTFAMMERDLSQALPRYIRDQYGDPMPAVLLGSGPYLLEMTRTGWTNPIGLPRSSLQRVAYELNGDGELLRHFWLVLDRAEDSEPITQTILTGVEDFRINMLNEDGETTDVWPDTNSQLILPLAAEVFLQTSAYGELRRVFDFVETPGANIVGATDDEEEEEEGQDEESIDIEAVPEADAESDSEVSTT